MFTGISASSQARSPSSGLARCFTSWAALGTMSQVSRLVSRETKEPDAIPVTLRKSPSMTTTWVRDIKLSGKERTTAESSSLVSQQQCRIDLGGRKVLSGTHSRDNSHGCWHLPVDFAGDNKKMFNIRDVIHRTTQYFVIKPCNAGWYCI